MSAKQDFNDINDSYKSYLSALHRKTRITIFFSFKIALELRSNHFVLETTKPLIVLGCQSTLPRLLGVWALVEQVLRKQIR